jgi:hypothetical protein
MLYLSLTDIQEQIEEEAREERCRFCLATTPVIYGFTCALVEREPAQTEAKQRLFSGLPFNRHA